MTAQQTLLLLYEGTTHSYTASKRPECKEFPCIWGRRIKNKQCDDGYRVWGRQGQETEQPERKRRATTENGGKWMKVERVCQWHDEFTGRGKISFTHWKMQGNGQVGEEVEISNKNYFSKRFSFPLSPYCRIEIHFNRKSVFICSSWNLIKVLPPYLMYFLESSIVPNILPFAITLMAYNHFKMWSPQLG